MNNTTSFVVNVLNEPPYNILCVRNLNFVLLRLIQVLCNLIFVIVTVLFHNLSSSLRYYNYHEQCHFMLSVAS